MKRKISLVIALILGLFASSTGAADVSSMRVQNMMRMQSRTQQATHTCQSTINMYKKGPANYRFILGTGQTYSDPDFKAGSDAIYWRDYQRTGSASLAYYGSYSSWNRARSYYPSLSLFGSSGVDITDIT